MKTENIIIEDVNYVLLKVIYNTPTTQNPKSVMSKLIVSELIDTSINQFNVKIATYKLFCRQQ